MSAAGLASARWALVASRLLLAVLFIAGSVQKALDPGVVEDLLAYRGWPAVLVWPALAFNVLVAVSLITGRWLAPVAIAASLYCMITSVFHFIPSDPWQMSIFIKNWAIAGGFLAVYSADLSIADRSAPPQ